MLANSCWLLEGAVGVNSDILGSSMLVNDAFDAPFELGPEANGVAFVVKFCCWRESIEVDGDGRLGVIIPQRLGND